MKPCTKCGFPLDMIRTCKECPSKKNKEKKLPMSVTEALQLIEKNEHIPALNYAINYAVYALYLISDGGEPSEDFKVQLLYVLNNMARWRQCKASTVTAAEIKECRAVLKKASK